MEEEFSEVRGSKLPPLDRSLGVQDGATGGFCPTIVDTLATTVAWICGKRLRLATSRLPENFSSRRAREVLRDPGIYVAMTINMLMVMRSKIVLIRVTMVIVYLSGTPPGFSLSARFLARPRPSGGCLKEGFS